MFGLKANIYLPLITCGRPVTYLAQPYGQASHHMTPHEWYTRTRNRTPISVPFGVEWDQYTWWRIYRLIWYVVINKIVFVHGPRVFVAYSVSRVPLPLAFFILLTEIMDIGRGRQLKGRTCAYAERALKIMWSHIVWKYCLMPHFPPRSQAVLGKVLPYHLIPYLSAFSQFHFPIHMCSVHDFFPSRVHNH